MQQFNLSVPLSAGPMLVQASAGTGKTWSIARLVARLLVEPGPGNSPPPGVRQVLVVTFTQAATAELRDRIRALLVQAAEAADPILNALQSGQAPQIPDPSDGLAVLFGSEAGGQWRPFDADEIERRAGLLRVAIADFDTAAISTIHGFCQRLLQELTFESGAPFGEELVKDVQQVVDGLLEDWLAQRLVPADRLQYQWLVEPKAGGISRSALQAIANAAIASPEAELRPAPPTEAELQTHRAAVGDFLRRTQSEFLSEWNSGREELVELVCGLPEVFNQRSFSPNQVRNAAADIDSWLASGCAKPLASLKLSQKSLAAGVKGKQALPPLPPLAAALDDWLAERNALQSVERAHFAGWIRRAFSDHLVATQQLTFDDMLRRVRDGLAREGEAGVAFLAALRSKFQVALIDEFQDTDAVQWAVFERVFCGSPLHRLVLIGDPKQAIYSFRGADIAVYERARAKVPPHRQYSMTRNFRSDGQLIEACNAMMGGRPSLFLTDSIAYEQVQAAKPPARLFGADGAALPPVVLRWVGSTSGDAQTGKQLLGQVVPDAARQIRQLLASGAQTEAKPNLRMPIRARDIAVLVSTNALARNMRAALLDEGVPAVLAQAGSVFDGEESWWLQLWLTALVDPTDARALRAFAATQLGGLSGRVLVAAQEGEPEASAVWEAFARGIHQQAKRFAQSGVTAAFSDLMQHATDDVRGDDRVATLLRLASQPTGERLLTNLRHLAELMAAAQLAERLTADGLVRWLKRQRNEAEDDAEAGQLRLESDADAVVITTLHQSKGLQYPIVFLLDLLLDNPIGGKDPGSRPFRFHPTDTADGSQLALDIRGLAQAPKEDSDRAWREAQEERQRLLYVALTRAEWQVVVYAGPVQDKTIAGKGTRHFLRSPIGLLLQAPGAAADRLTGLPDELADDAFAQLEAFADRVCTQTGKPLCVVELADDAAPLAAVPPRPAPDWLPLGRLTDFEPDDTWRFESYTGLIASRHGSKPDEDPSALGLPAPEERPGDDEDPDAIADAPTEQVAALADKWVVANPPESNDAADRDAPEVPLRRLPSGADAGKWVHEVLEHLRFAAQPLRPKAATETDESALAALVARHRERNGVRPAEVRLEAVAGKAATPMPVDRLLIEALPTILHTPLGAAALNKRLADLNDAHRLDELKFDLPVGNLAADGNVLGSALAQALVSRDDGFALPGDYLQHLRQMGFRTLRGFLTGTIDLVFCATEGAEMRWFVVDYKTNLLGPTEQQRIARSQPQHYRRPWLEAEIARKHYYVQYVLYLTALHRYLSLRLRDYDYDRHMGGAVYLFVRGMPGEATRPEDCAANRVPGVYFDRPPKALIERVSGALSGLAMAPAEAA